LEYPVWQREAIRQVLQRLIQQVCDQLFQRGEGVLRLNCRLDIPAGPALQVPVGLYQPSANAEHLLGLVDLQLERVRIREPVTAVQVTATASDRLEARQLEIADCGFRISDYEQRRRLAHLVDRLSSRLGRDAVLAPHLLADAVPECACRLEPVTGLKQSSSKKSRSSTRYKLSARKTNEGYASPTFQPDISGRSTSLLRPLWLNPQPIPLPVTAVIPDGPPIRFRWSGRCYEVAAWWGPERIETAWWRKHEPRRVRRDYYRVETTSGQRFWLFRHRDDDKWFLHGEFD
jgi:protein ImuB